MRRGRASVSGEHPGLRPSSALPVTLSIDVMRRAAPQGVPSAEEELAARFVRGEPGAVVCVARWAGRSVRFEASWIRPEDRADVVQNALIDLWRALRAPDFRVAASLRAVVRRVAIARAIDWSRKRRDESALPADLPATSPDAGARLLRRTRRRVLRRALLSLRGDDLELLRLRYVVGLGYAEISVRLGRSQATLRGRMCDCRALLRERAAELSGRPGDAR